MGIVLPAEGDTLAIEGEASVIADCHSVRVAGEITEHLSRAAESGFGVDYPVLPEYGAEQDANRFGSDRAAIGPWKRSFFCRNARRRPATVRSCNMKIRFGRNVALTALTGAALLGPALILPCSCSH